MNKEPYISVILPVQNAGKFLAECLKSISSQNYKSLEIIAIDDKSSDESYKILKYWKKRDRRLKIYRNVKRYGLSITLNRALRRAQGEFIAFMNATDVSTPNRFKKQVSYLLENPKTVAVGTQCYFLTSENKRVGKSSFPAENSAIYDSFLKKMSLQFETLMVNKMIIPKDILYFKPLSYPFVYTDVLAKMLPYGKVGNLLEFLHLRRVDEPSSERLGKLVNTAKLWVQSITQYDYRPSLRSIVEPLVRQA